MAVLSSSAAAGAVAMALAPSGARGWAAIVVVTAWVILAATLFTTHRVNRRMRNTAADRTAEADRLNASVSALEADTAHTADVALPALIRLLRSGWSANDALGQVPLPRSPRQRKLLHLLAATVEEQEQQTASLRAEGARLHEEMAAENARLREDMAAENARLHEDMGAENARLHEQMGAVTSEVERFTLDTLPSVTARLREGESGATVRAEVTLPEQPLLRASVEAVVRELALSERRALAAQTASAKALSRVQAKSVSMLADLRGMQERHGAEVFGDLLKLDHSTSQLGLMTDRLALLMGGRPSRAWNRPIVMESILRGAVGRIAAYQRVRLHCASKVSVSGFAAEGVMHLLAELMDNAANFSPPIDEVHVYVEERGTGIVVTIEDSGLKMADAAMRRAADSVAGRMTDLASLQGTRLGLAVVGRLAVKHGISVNYRPSSRGGTGVVVLLPRHLIAQEARDGHQAPPRPTASAPVPAPVSTPAPTPVTPSPTPTPVSTPASVTPTPTPASASAPPPPAPAMPTAPQTPAPTPEQSAPAPAAPLSPAPSAADEPPVVRPRAPEPDAARPAAHSTPNGLPVRTPGRTMGEAERERGRHRGSPAPASPAPGAPGNPPRTSPPRSAGQQFGAFHRGRRPQGKPEGPESGPVPPSNAP